MHWLRQVQTVDTPIFGLDCFYLKSKWHMYNAVLYINGSRGGVNFLPSFSIYFTMSTRKAINRVAAGGLKYKPIYTPPPPPPPPKQKPKLGPILIGGSLLYVTATYVSMLVFKSKSDTNDIVAGKTEKPSVTPATYDTSNVWKSVAKKYDQEIGWDEVVMGVGLLRRWLIGKAKVGIKKRHAYIKRKRAQGRDM